ncbi:MAG TPA: NADH-quinone oxidoreductase subunit NuoE [Spirochaetes bacterium]|nr:NADH-quinone oxidoreductase subunit NuoE [Spirochaetota bacterium]
MIENEEKLDQIIEDFKIEQGTIIGLMQDILEIYRYLPEEALQKISSELEIPLAKLYTLATFYNSFRLEPVGKHHVCVCIGTACHVNGAPKIVDTLERELKIKAGETTEDNRFTLETVNCLGACALGPLVTVDKEYHGKIDQGKLKKLLKKYRED